jgi:hypothetical protein
MSFQPVYPVSDRIEANLSKSSRQQQDRLIGRQKTAIRRQNRVKACLFGVLGAQHRYT